MNLHNERQSQVTIYFLRRQPLSQSNMQYFYSRSQSSTTLTREDGKIVINWGAFRPESKEEIEAFTKFLPESLEMNYEEAKQFCTNAGIIRKFLESENPEELKVYLEVEGAKRKAFTEKLRKEENEKKAIMDQKIKNGEWKMLGMRLVDAKTGEKIVF